MNTPKPSTRVNWSRLMLKTPPIAALVSAARGEITDGRSPAEVRRTVVRGVAESPLASLKALFPNVGRVVRRMPLEGALVAIARHFARKAHVKTTGAFLQRIARDLGYDEWLADLVMAYAQTGEVLPAYQGFTGGVTKMNLGTADEPVHVLALMVGPLSDLEDLIEKLRDEAADAFPDASFARLQNPDRDLDRFAAFYADKLRDSEIAWRELEAEHPGQIVHENPAFAEQHRKRTNAVRQARNRFDDHVTELVDPVSRDSETD